MAKRRAHGEGTIYQRQDGRWCAQLTLANGRRKTKYADTQREAKEWLMKTRKEYADGLLLDAGKATMAQFLDRWYNDVAVHTLRPATQQGYRYVIERHIKPAIGKVALSSLRPDHLQHLYSDALNAGYAAKTVLYIHAVLHKSLGQAVKWGLVARNVADAVEPPRYHQKAPKTLTADQVRLFLESVKEDRYYALYLLAVSTGMRQAELLGLTWEFVDLDHATIHVAKTLQRINGRVVMTEPKTDKSRRSIALPDVVLAALREHQVNQLKEGLRMGEVGENTQLVFTNRNGKPIQSHVLRVAFARALKRAGLPKIRFHDLRHTAATLLLSRGAHPKVVQEMLGHSHISMTLDIYSHVVPDMQRESAQKMNAILVG